MKTRTTNLLFAAAGALLIGTLSCRTPEKTSMDGMDEHPASQPSEHPDGETSEHPQSEHPEHPASEHPEG